MTTKTARADCCCGSKTSCGCPRCTGLECLERPRFFAGQLLTEAELNGEQDYVRAKNRLHNLHLHGWGVVCGLEVVCHECEGWVTVRPGYAIDPCGEDVIVCCEHPLDVAEMIRRCKENRRRRRKADCEPLRRTDAACDEGRVEHWCITLSYAEREARPTAALRRGECDVCGCGPGCTCGCPCHGEEGGNGGCGRHGGEKAGRGASGPSQEVRRGTGKTVSPCEPTRVLETYCLDVCEAPEDYCEGLESAAERAWKQRLRDCIDGLTRTLKKSPLNAVGTLADVQMRDLNISSSLGAPAGSLTTGVLHDSYCQVYDFLRELFRRNPGNAHCALIDRLDELDCPRPDPNDDVASYTGKIRQPSQQLLGYLVTYLLDCFCWAVMPPCSPCCPGEDELILACLTVRDGKIEHICNYSCRRWAGAFPPTVNGIHLGPVWPLVAKLLGTVCCGDLVERFLGFARGSEVGRATAAFIAEDNLARPRVALDQIRAFSFADLVGPATADDRLNMAALLNRPWAEVEAAAEAKGVELTGIGVDEAPPRALLAALPAARRGDRVVVYTREGKVVGFARQGSAEAALVDQSLELNRLRKEVLVNQRTELAKLKEEVAALRRGVGGADRG